MTAIRVWCRSGALRSPPRSSANRSSSRRSMSSTDITRTLAAASSIASGSPSRRRTTRRTASSSQRYAGARGRGALREQVRGGVLGELAEREDPLGRDRERRPGGGDHPQLAAGGDQEGDQVGDRLDDVLAVVEDQQRRRLVEQLGDPGADVVALLGGEHPAAAHRVADAERGADLADDVLGRRRRRPARRSAPPAAPPRGRAGAPAGSCRARPGRGSR